jgi:broad specificity phosphatase PhoE
MRRLTLIRHGPSSYVHRGWLLGHADMLAWRTGYDAAGIRDRKPPPRGLQALVATADIIIASDLPRAVMTADRLADGRDVLTTPLLREAPADVPAWSGLKMPYAAWEWAMRVRRLYRVARRTDIAPHDLERASKAAFWLDHLSEEHEHIAVVTHGVFRRILARQLQRVGWQRYGRRRSYAHWSVWSLVR